MALLGLSGNLLLDVAFCSVSVLVGLYVYRLFFHPLKGFPGPKLAGASLWYEFYWNCVCRGQYVWRIKEMHAKYGPIIRIAPDEIHVNDPSFIPELMPSVGHRRNKDPRALQNMALSNAVGTTVPHELHRARRNAMAKTLSKESVRRLEPLMVAGLDKLLRRLDGARDADKELNLFHVFSAFTCDLITQYAFGENYKWLESPNFNRDFSDTLDGLHELGPYALQFKWLFPAITSAPAWLSRKAFPNMMPFIKFRKGLENTISRVVNLHHEGKPSKTIFNEILESSLPETEKEPARLVEEAQNISIAGTGTTSWTLSVIVFYLLKNPPVLEKLQDELRAAFPDRNELPTLKKAEQLPYLGAVITEGLRISSPVSARQMRIAPDEDLIYNDGKRTWSIPKGTAVGMTAPLLHLDETLFPEPLSFKPERFLQNRALKRCTLPFSAGSRQCLGMNLAYAELHLIMSVLWRRYGGTQDKAKGDYEDFIELYKTDHCDVEMVHDLFVPYQAQQSRGIQVKVKKVDRA